MDYTLSPGLIARRNPLDENFWHLIHANSGQKICFRQSLKECRQVAEDISFLTDWTVDINALKAAFNTQITRPQFLDGFLQAETVTLGTVINQVIRYGI